MTLLSLKAPVVYRIGTLVKNRAVPDKIWNSPSTLAEPK